LFFIVFHITFIIVYTCNGNKDFYERGSNAVRLARWRKFIPSASSNR